MVVIINCVGIVLIADLICPKKTVMSRSGTKISKQTGFLTFLLIKSLGVCF